MESVYSLKRRSSSPSLSLCIICQKDGKDLRQAGKQGLVTLRDAVTTQSKLRDIRNRDVINRLEVVLQSTDAESTRAQGEHISAMEFDPDSYHT